MPLGVSDEDLLRGRTPEVLTIVENCEINRLTVVTSAPGLGLSSLLGAGVVPALQRAGFITVVYSDWQGRSFVTRLGEAIAVAVRDQTGSSFAADLEPLQDLLARARQHSGKPLAVLFDQFEDYLRCHKGTDISDDFDAMLSKTVSARVSPFVIGLQTQAIPAFERFSQHIPNLFGHRITLLPLSAHAAKELVRAAAARTGMEVEPEAVDQIVDSPAVTVTGGVHPLFANLAADRLFKKEAKLHSSRASADTLEENGGVESMILRSLDPLFDEMKSSRSELFFRWTPLLLTQDGHRRAATEKALTAVSGRWKRFVKTLLPLLVKNGLLRTIEMQEGTRYEFARESISVVVRDWSQRREASLVVRRRVMFRMSAILTVIAMGYVVYVFLTLKPQ